VAAGFVASLVAHRRIARQPVPIALATLIVLAGVIAVAPIAPFVRSWLFLLPLYLIQASAGLSWAFRRLGPVAPALAAVALGVAVLHAGLKNADVPPNSDNNVVGLLRQYVPKNQSVLIDRYVRAPTVNYYFERYGDPVKEVGLLRTKDRQTGHIVVVVANGTSPADTVYKAGGIPSDAPRLLIKREWIAFYDVPIFPHAQAKRLHFKGPKDRPQ
jgi:hypothetical protein